MAVKIDNASNSFLENLNQRFHEGNLAITTSTGFDLTLETHGFERAAQTKRGNPSNESLFDFGGLLENLIPKNEPLSQTEEPDFAVMEPITT